MIRPLTEEEKEAIWIALDIRRNIIQTGNYSLSAKDVENIGAESAKKKFGAKIGSLDTNQMKLIILTEKLIEAALQNRLRIVEGE